MAHCGSSNPGVFESISHQMKMGNKHSEWRKVGSDPTGVDSVVMVLDAAAKGTKGDRGADPQTLRGLPIARQADPDLFDLLDEIEQSLALDMTPASWPIGMGRDFRGTYDLFADALLLFERGVHDRVTEPVRCNGLEDPKLPRLLP
jgi:peptide chain release factor 3